MSFLESWAAAPASTPSPFPPPSGNQPWQMGDLPADRLAELLAARGYARPAETFDRVELDSSPVARALLDELLANVLDELADIVDTTADVAADRARLAAPYLGAYTPEALDAHYQGPARLVPSLRATARDIRRKPRAARIIVARVIARLPVRKLADDAHELASSWLAQHDAAVVVRRAELVRRYVGDHSPGGLNASELRELMATRWGSTVKRDGYDVHRPAAARSGTGPDLDGIAALLRVPVEELAALVEQHNPGVTP
jgi:hypothetical protein